MYLKIEELTSGYGEKNVIDRLSVGFDGNDFCALIGPNGCGKSTLLKTLIRHIHPIAGKAYLHGKDTHAMSRNELSRELALIPQDFHLQFDYLVEDVVMMGRFPYLDTWRDYTKADREMVDSILEKLDLLGLRKQPFSQLSGGEQQRVSIARALAQDTNAILMDESFSHLDINHQLEIMQLIRTINREEGKLVILVSHNINLAISYCPRILLMKAGKLVADGSPADVVTESNLREVFGITVPLVRNPATGHPMLSYPID